jgi:hypothetical protein
MGPVTQCETGKTHACGHVEETPLIGRADDFPRVPI